MNRISQYYPRKFALALCIVIVLLFLPILVLCTDSIGNAAAYNGDIIGYVESFKKMYYGFVSRDMDYSWSINTFGYGGGFFIILLPITVLAQAFSNSDVLLLLVLRLSGCVFLCFSLLFMDMLIRDLLPAGERSAKITFVLLVVMLMLYPTTILLVTRIHPEMLQLFLCCAGIYLLCRYDDLGKTRYLIFASVLWGMAVGTKISGAILLAIPYVMIVFKRESWGRRIIKAVCFTAIVGIVAVLFISQSRSLEVTSRFRLLERNSRIFPKL